MKPLISPETVIGEDGPPDCAPPQEAVKVQLIAQPLAGGLKLSVAVMLPAVPKTLLGASGTVTGAVGMTFTAVDEGLVPIMLVAVTEHE